MIGSYFVKKNTNTNLKKIAKKTKFYHKKKSKEIGKS